MKKEDLIDRLKKMGRSALYNGWDYLSYNAAINDVIKILENAKGPIK